MSNEATRQETQRFAIFNILVCHCGERLSPENVEKISAEIVEEMRHGACSWAFNFSPDTTTEP